MTNGKLLAISSLLTLAGGCAEKTADKGSNPNIVFIISDDIGYGDIGCYGAQTIKTPNIDALAAKGVRFTNAYSPASTSSPTRYSLLTGEYAFRKGVGILAGDDPLSIDPCGNTLPQQMQSAGYTTAIVGKWHLGLGKEGERVDFNKEVKYGMRAVGFDYSFIYPATNDRVPTIYMENDRMVGYDPNDPIEVCYTHKIGEEPTGKENPELLKLKHFQGHDNTIINGIGRIGWSTGGKAAEWRDEEMADTLLSKAVAFIEDDHTTPFYLHYAPQNAHEPRVPSDRFRGVSEAGVYGDVIEELDYCVGEVVAALERKGILDNTIIVFTSDNGPMIKEGYVDGALENIGSHDPFGGLSGAKYSLLEGGSRVPFIAVWGSEIKEPFVQEQRFSYLDMLATFAAITNSEPNKGTLNDSFDASELFFNKDAKIYRPYVVTQNNPGDIAVRCGDMKYIMSVGNSPAQLYDLAADPSEKNNLIDNAAYINIVAELEAEVIRLKGKLN